MCASASAFAGVAPELSRGDGCDCCHARESGHPAHGRRRLSLGRGMSGRGLRLLSGPPLSPGVAPNFRAVTAAIAVMPAKAGIETRPPSFVAGTRLERQRSAAALWTPAFAGVAPELSRGDGCDRCHARESGHPDQPPSFVAGTRLERQRSAAALQTPAFAQLSRGWRPNFRAVTAAIAVMPAKAAIQIIAATVCRGEAASPAEVRDYGDTPSFT